MIPIINLSNDKKIYFASDFHLGTPSHAESLQREKLIVKWLDSIKKDAQAIVHAHSTCATAVSTHKRGIPSFHYMVAMAGGHDIKCAKYATFGTRELSKNILKALKGRKACLISNHGQIAFEESLSKAFELAQEVENISLQYITSLKLGKPKILSINEMKKVLSKAKNYKRG